MNGLFYVLELYTHSVSCSKIRPKKAQCGNGLRVSGRKKWRWVPPDRVDSQQKQKEKALVPAGLGVLIHFTAFPEHLLCTKCLEMEGTISPLS